MLGLSRSSISESDGPTGSVISRINTRRPDGDPIVNPDPPGDGPKQLSLTTPGTVETGVSASFGVATDVAPLTGQSFLVTVAFSGVTTSPTSAQVTLTPGSPTGTVATTPSSDGTLTATATASMLSGAVATCSVITPEPAIDYEDSYGYSINAGVAFGSAYANNAFGDTVQLSLQTEFDGSPYTYDKSPGSFKLHSINAYNGAPNSTAKRTKINTTQILRGDEAAPSSASDVQPAYPMVERIEDPGGGGHWAYHIHLHEGYHYHNPSKNSLQKWRCNLVPTGNSWYVDFDREMWWAVGFCITETMLKGTSDGWWLMFSHHQRTAGNVMQGGPCNLHIEGGNGNIANAYLLPGVEWYNSSNWRTGTYTGGTVDQMLPKVEDRKFLKGGMAVGDQLWIVGHSRWGCGYHDANHGAIYGDLNPGVGYTAGNISGIPGAQLGDGSKYFCEQWHALNDDPLVQTFRYTGWCGGPYDPSEVESSVVQTYSTPLGTIKRVQRPTYLYTGLYQNQKMLPKLYTPDPEERDIVTYGCRVYYPPRNPVDHETAPLEPTDDARAWKPEGVLAAFKASLVPYA